MPYEYTAEGVVPIFAYEHTAEGNVPLASYEWTAEGAVLLDASGTPARVNDGYGSVANMLAQDEFYWAHRGGSRDFNEMTMYAYDSSVALGYGALEFSAHKTSDDVWFGLHDADLTRTSGVAWTPGTRTWAEIQTQTVLGSSVPNAPGSANQPYMRVEDLLDKYGDTHVIILDPKHDLNDVGELLDLALTRMPKERIICKFFGDSSAVAAAAASRDITSWGYFYDDSYDSDDFDDWDILGLNYNAPGGVFDIFLATGKPLVGHICQSKTDRNAARSEGAVGFQCSGVVAIDDRPDYEF